MTNGVNDNSKKVAILMSNSGPTVYGMIRSLVDVDAERESSIRTYLIF